MSEVNEQIGDNIRRIRKSKKMTQNRLADAYSQITGQAISSNMISMWENGQRRMYADQVYAICRCLEVTPTLISPRPEEYNDDVVLDEIEYMPPAERRILFYLYNIWDGNSKAMTHFIGMYMSLPRRLRQDIAGMGIHMYQLALKDGMLDPTAPEFDVCYIEEAAEKLWTWKLSEF